jgi:hypothetical protein
MPKTPAGRMTLSNRIAMVELAFIGDHSTACQAALTRIPVFNPQDQSMAATKTASTSHTRLPKNVPTADLGKSPAELIDARIEQLSDWRGHMLARLRAVIRSADPEIFEEWKWNIPVWSGHGIICTGETYKRAVKLTFAKGAWLPDPAKLFNSSLQGNVRRAIDFTEGAEVDETALHELVLAALRQNKASAGGKARRAV